MMKRISTMFFVFLFPLCLFGQEIFKWANPSFEGIPQVAKLPSGWSNLFEGDGNSPVDIQPGFFDCKEPPFDGSTYVGMVMRADGSHEGIYQYLEKPLLKNSTYEFSIWVCRSPEYNSPTRTSSKSRFENFNTPATLVVLGLDENVIPIEHLAQSALIEDSNWSYLEFVIKPQQRDYHFIALAVMPEKGKKVTANGNILIDRLSPIKLVNHLVVTDSSSNWQQKLAMEYYLNNNEILLNNPNFTGKGVKSFYGAWDLFVADKTSVSIYNAATKINDEVPTDSTEMEPGFGNHGLYLVANKNGKWSGTGQKLPYELVQNDAYKFSVYLSYDGSGKLNANKEPLRFRIWGGSSDNPRQELLAKTYAVDSRKPKEYSFMLEPKIKNWDYLYMEAFSITDGVTYYSGNMKITRCSTIQLIKK